MVFPLDSGYTKDRQNLLSNYKHRSQSAAISAIIVLFLASSLLWTSISRATELFIPGVKGQVGKPIEVTVNIDQVDNLAGIKLVMKYDPKILLYKKSNKSKYTTSFMHIVNNKSPGLLIAVMAGAKGIKGKDFPVLLLTFEVKKGLKGSLSTKLEIIELQLMSDQLKDIKSTIRISPIVISTQ